MAIGTLSVKISADIAQFNKDIASISKSLNAQTKGLQTVAKSMTSVGDSMTKGVTVPLIAVGAILLKVGKDFDDAYDKIRIGTGKTGTALDGLKTDFKAVAKDSASSFGDISTAIAGINSRLGLTGKPLQELTTQMTNFARITGSDINTLVPATTRVFGDWSIATKDQSKAMDTLFKVSQTTGISAATLSERVVELGAPLRNLGFSFAEATALMGKWEKEGVNTTTVMSGLRQALRVFAAEGVTDTKAALMDLVERMKNAGTTGEAAAIGVKYFGKGLNDVVDTARGGKFDIAELVKTIEGSTDTINKAADATDDWKEKLQKGLHNAMVELEPVANKVFNSLTGAVDKVMPKIKDLAEWFGKLTETQMDNILKWGLIVAAIGPALSIIGRTMTGVIQLTNNIKLLNAAIQSSKFLLGGAATAALVAMGAATEALADKIDNQLVKTIVNGLIPTMGGFIDVAKDDIEVARAMADGIISWKDAQDLNIFTIKEHIQRIRELRAATEEIKSPMIGYYEQMHKNTFATTEEKIATQDKETAITSLMAQYPELTRAQAEEKLATDANTEANKAETQSVDDLIASLYQLYNLNQSVTEATWTYDDALKNLDEVMKNANSTERDKKTALFQTQDALEILQVKMLKEYQDTKTSIESKKELQNQYIKTGLQAVASGVMSEEEFVNMAATFGLTSAQIISFADAMGIKIDAATRARIIGISVEAATVQGAVANVINWISSIKDKTVNIDVAWLGAGAISAIQSAVNGVVGKTVHINTVYGKEGLALGFSQGGPVMPLPRFDNGGVLAMLHPPEVVLNGKQALNMVWNQAQERKAVNNVSNSKQEILLNQVINLDGKVLWESNEKYAIRATGERV